MDNQLNQTYPFSNPPLPYAYNALEPFIDAKTMELHHDKHLQTYVDNLNKVIAERPTLQSWSLEKLVFLAGSLPASIATSVTNNAGGVYNHIFYFNQLKQNANASPGPELNGLINKSFGSFDSFKTLFTEKALSVFGSGYAWLTLGADCKLKILTTPNQLTPLTERLCPILNLDVWEHAYYLKHYNNRAAYIADFFNIINWDMLEERLIACLNKTGCDQQVRNTK